MTQLTPIESLLEDLRSPLDAYPQELVNELLARRDEAIPELLALFEDQERLFEDVVDCGELLPFFALYMLAYLQEKRFYPVLLNVLHWEFADADDFDAFWGDILFEDVSSILFSVYDGNSEPLVELALNTNLNLMARSLGLSVLGMLYAHEKIERSILVNAILKCLELEKNSPEEYNFVLSEACSQVLDLQLYECKNEAYWTIENKLQNFSRVEELTNAFAIDPLVARKEYLESLHNQGITDIEKSVDWWFKQAIHPDDESDEDADDEFEFLHEGDEEAKTLSVPIVRVEAKTGRNDPCPCGSGKKFKKCCDE